jgi:hypothetical protein
LARLLVQLLLVLLLLVQLRVLVWRRASQLLLVWRRRLGAALWARQPWQPR